MESIQKDTETSRETTRIYDNYLHNNTSDINLSISSDATGTVDITGKGTEGPDVEWLSYSSTNMRFYSRLLNIIPKRLSLQFSEKVENFIIHDTIFRKFIREVEKSLNEFIEYEQETLESRIFFEEDWEIPDYEKLVLSLNFKGIPFEQEMSLWKKINTITYEKIKSLILTSSKEHTGKIKELKRKFFIKLEM
ncbi:MAG: hypothetical protein ACFFG0_37665 [Candidatus Thorarchaeota archaeon]